MTGTGSSAVPLTPKSCPDLRGGERCPRMSKTNFTTVPIRCPSCGQQTHKTLEAIRQNGGLVCTCGAFTKVELSEFEDEIKKSASAIKDFGKHG
jgi:transcription elongation factor Elf1